MSTDFVDAARARGFTLWAGVPCSYLTAFLNRVAGDSRLDYIAAANEGVGTTPPPPLRIGPGMLADGDPHAGGLFVQGRVQRGGQRSG